jgi:hypothetical protein
MANRPEETRFPDLPDGWAEGRLPHQSDPSRATPPPVKRDAGSRWLVFFVVLALLPVSIGLGLADRVTLAQSLVLAAVALGACAWMNYSRK